MSKSETKNRGDVGYFLPEDSQFRLRKLHQHIEFLSRLAEPRVDEEEDGPEIDHPALAGCLELLAEQVQQVLDTVSWPARLEAKGTPTSVVIENEDADDADGDAGCEHDDPAGPSAQADQDFAFGMTLDQLDESDRLLDLLRAQGDLLMAAGSTDVADGTITVIGAAIFEGADEMKDLIRQVNAQVLDAPTVGGRVREMPAVYGSAGSAAHVH
ncbi:XAC0095 family protein [Luteimonas sp. WGS1318]|uniref:XAC0095 family protein n=1 Tax=Luteimonas sp. WGS1318 TaxID=3366815 RepID=UPI00372D1011